MTSATASSTVERLWAYDDIAAYLGVAARTVRSWAATDPTFPRPLPLPGRTCRWLPDDIFAWVLGEPGR